MVGRLWRNYWVGAWMLAIGVALVPLGWLLGAAMWGTGIAGVTGLGVAAAFASWCVGGALAVVGFAVWAYRFHTEPRT
jgi:hypothetical protein